VALFGDAASVSILENEAPLAICKSTFGNDGGKGAAAIVWGSGTAKEPGEPERFRLDGRGIYELLKTEAPISIRECAALNGITLDEVDLFLFHQASAWLLKGLLEDLKLPPEKVPINIKHVGNAVSTSIPLLLENVLYGGKPLPRIALMSGFGAGLAWGSLVLRSA
jgi:3-oxoacyl-[acyl-carrier-protein] synthase-3